jgi:diguanylate cyclase (GGDEF)-like protein
MPKARILAVDDQLYFRVFLEDLLQQEGYEVCTASGGEEAFHLFERECFDVILTDLVMPETDGSELVQRVKARDPDQEIVVVTSDADVKTAVEAMKLGATDYLLKPIDRSALLRTLEGILQRRRMREEHARLMAENLEFMGVFSLYERALGLHATLSLEPLADRIVEGLCLETHAQGGVFWVARHDDQSWLRLMGVRGLVHVDDEREELHTAGLPNEMAALAEDECISCLGPADAESDPDRVALYVAMKQGGRPIGIARLTDKLDRGEFGDADRVIAERFANFAGQAVANAVQFRALERRSFRDPTTKAYTRAYFDDVVHNEIQKANRFGRTFSTVLVEFDGMAAVRDHKPQAEFERWLEAVTYQIGRSLRATDLLAAESDSQFLVLLPETDAIGAAVLKRRIRSGLDRCEELRSVDPIHRPAVLAAAATFPADGTQIEVLRRALESRIHDDRSSLVRSLELEKASFAGAVDALLAEAKPGRPETGEQMTRFLLGEVSRRPDERGMLFVAPGASLFGALREGLDALRGLPVRTEVVLVADRKTDQIAGVPVTWVSSVRAGTTVPFLVYYGEGPPYAMIRDEQVEDGSTAFYHTSDPVLVEHLAFQLGRDLGVPIGD